MIATKTKASRNRAQIANRLWTYAEMEAELPESNQLTELWGRAFIMAPSASFEDQDPSFHFRTVLDAWVTERDLGKVRAAPQDMVASLFP